MHLNSSHSLQATVVTLAAKLDLDKTIEVGMWWGLVLILLLVGIWLIVIIRSRFRGREDHAATAHLMLSQLGELHREGDLTDDEFRSIKNRLINQIDGEVREGESADKPDSFDNEEKPG